MRQGNKIARSYERSRGGRPKIAVEVKGTETVFEEKHSQERYRMENVVLTGDTHAIAPVQGIPKHGSIGDWYQRLWEFIWIGSESVQ